MYCLIWNRFSNKIKTQKKSHALNDILGLDSNHNIFLEVLY